MGEYFDKAYTTAKELEKAQNMCEIQQLYYFKIFIKKVKGDNLIDAMKNKNWENIAYYYDGAKWRVTNPDYPIKFKKNYDKKKNKITFTILIFAALFSCQSKDKIQIDKNENIKINKINDDVKLIEDLNFDNYPDTLKIKNLENGRSILVILLSGKKNSYN